MTVRTSEAVWNGTLKEGNGTMKLASGRYEGPYTWASRFADETGTNPEELIAAAHAGCFSMALAFALTAAGFEPESLETKANLTMEKLEQGWTIVSINLKLEGKVPGLSAEQFQEYAQSAKAGCPVSRLLNCTITLDANLVL